MRKIYKKENQKIKTVESCFIQRILGVCIKYAPINIILDVYEYIFHTKYSQPIENDALLSVYTMFCTNKKELVKNINLMYFLMVCAYLCNSPDIVSIIESENHEFFNKERINYIYNIYETQLNISPLDAHDFLSRSQINID
jgi:hypothetical protein